jgi:uncharacterized protein YbaA (DUF1428 family)
MPPYTLKQLAEAGYVMGLPTIGEVASHMMSHHYAYFMTDYLSEEITHFELLVKGHEDESIFKYLTDEDKKRMDDELEKAMEEGPREEAVDDEEEI